MGPKQLKKLESIASTSNKGVIQLTKYSPLSYQPKPLQCVDIGPYGSGCGHKEFIDDCMQMYAQALMYIITKDTKHAQKSIDIMTAWCTTCTVFKGSNAPLECGWGGAAMVRSAELLKYVCPKLWTQTQDAMLNAFIKTILLPNLTGRYNEIAKWNNNWILTIQEALLQIALYQDDMPRVSKILDEFKQSLCKCVAEDGFSTETKRDMCHLCFQIGSMVQVAEMAWHQGIDLYSHGNSRIVKCMEYHAFILNGGVPAGLTKEDLKQVWFQPCAWDIGYNHFVNRKNASMPETKKLMETKNNRPERIVFNWGPAWVHEQSG